MYATLPNDAITSLMCKFKLEQCYKYHTKFKARSKCRSTHVPNLTDQQLSPAEEWRLNQFGSAG